MHELIARVLYFLQIHLLFASLVWCAAWLLTLRKRANAGLSYAIWVATLFNFLFPVGALIDQLAKSHLHWASPLAALGDLANQISRSGALSTCAGVVWLLGAGVMFARLGRRLWLDRLEARALSARPPDRQQFMLQGIAIKFAGANQTPAVNGLLRPHILLPQGIERLLTRDELRAVLLHELTHARRRDNLIRLIQELARCLLWFHPFIWFTASRLVLYRELSCDDSVIKGAAGYDLIGALSKLTNPEREPLMRASVASLMSRRLARLADPREPLRSRYDGIIAAGFSAALFCGILETVAHTACCFLATR